MIACGLTQGAGLPCPLTPAASEEDGCRDLQKERAASGAPKALLDKGPLCQKASRLPSVGLVLAGTSSKVESAPNNHEGHTAMPVMSCVWATSLATFFVHMKRGASSGFHLNSCSSASSSFLALPHSQHISTRA